MARQAPVPGGWAVTCNVLDWKSIQVGESSEQRRSRIYTFSPQRVQRVSFMVLQGTRPSAGTNSAVRRLGE